jgi:hypothetical protein
LLADREAEIDDIEHTLTDLVDEREEAIVEKQRMRAEGMTTEAEQRRYRELEMLLNYYDARKANAETRRRELGVQDDT